MCFKFAFSCGLPKHRLQTRFSHEASQNTCVIFTRGRTKKIFFKFAFKEECQNYFFKFLFIFLSLQTCASNLLFHVASQNTGFKHAFHTRPPKTHVSFLHEAGQKKYFSNLLLKKSAKIIFLNFFLFSCPCKHVLQICFFMWPPKTQASNTLFTRGLPKHMCHFYT